MMEFDIAKIKLFPEHFFGQLITIKGWVKGNRSGKSVGFIVINDGLSSLNLQVVYSSKLSEFTNFKKITLGSAIQVTGKLVIAQNKQEKIEINATTISVINLVATNYFLQKKHHSKEFLRTKAELRARSSYFYAIFKLRNTLSWAIHNFFHKNNFLYLHNPIITSNDCEGGGEIFNVVDQNEEESNGFLGNLTVSGQLHAEAFAQTYQKVYTFAPTFRADKSNTRFHSAEFWMVEPEMAFAQCQDGIDLATKLLKSISKAVYIHNQRELQYLSKLNNLDLITRIEKLVKEPFLKIDYQEAIDILKLKWGTDLNKEQELNLSQYFHHQPLFIVNFPAEIKAFYMKKNPDQKTVACFDLLLSDVGEVIGGSQREDDYHKLLQAAKNWNLNFTEMAWYLNLRQQGYGGSTGFGLGLDRFLMYLTGTENIRDTIPFFVGRQKPGY